MHLHYSGVETKFVWKSSGLLWPLELCENNVVTSSCGYRFFYTKLSLTAPLRTYKCWFLAISFLLWWISTCVKILWLQGVCVKILWFENFKLLLFICMEGCMSRISKLKTEFWFWNFNSIGRHICKQNHFLCEKNVVTKLSVIIIFSYISEKLVFLKFKCDAWYFHHSHGI